MIYLAIALVAYLALCFLLAWKYVSPSRTLPDRPQHAVDLTIPGPVAEIPVWCTAGLAAGKPKSTTLFVLAHGYGGNRESWAQALEDLNAAGYEVVVPEMPGHGASKDGKVGFGVKEADVILAATHWALERYPEDKPRVVAVGISMGGAACWLASAKEPSLFSAIATEGAYARLDQAANRWFDMLLPAGHVLLAPVRWMAESLSGVRTSSVNPVEAAKAWKGRPSLVIHCANDALIDASHPKRLQEAAGAESWEILGVDHAQGYGAAQTEYLERLEDLAKRAQSISTSATAQPITAPK